MTAAPTTAPTTAVSSLVAIIASGDMEAAREFAADNAGALTALRADNGARAAVAHACNRWGAPMVWPWGDTPTPTAAQQRLLVALRAAKPWRASEDTVAVCLACGWARVADGRIQAV